MLNVGCGDRLAPAPWVNVDCWPGVHPDVVADITTTWPFPTSSVGRVYMGQVLEHLDHPDGVRAAIGEAGRVLYPGGVFCVVTPDFAALDEKRCEGWIRENLTRGECRWPGDEHRWCPDRHTVAELVREVFPTAHAVHPMLLSDGWPPGNRDTWDCAVVGTALG